MVILICLLGPTYLLYTLLNARTDRLEKLALVRVSECSRPACLQTVVEQVGDVEELAWGRDPIEVRRGPEVSNQ